MTAALIPPDKDRCQAEKPNGATFMTLGGRPGYVRCADKPTVIALENEPGDDGQRGSMSLCDSCRDVMVKQLGADFCTFAKIEKEAERGQRAHRNRKRV